jgi:uncharacterized surface anchored protein
MRRAVLCCALSISAAVAQSTYTISGTVVIGPDKKPVKRALVRIAPVTTGVAQQSYVTGENGRFRFDNLPAGKFALSAERRNAPPEFFQEYEGYSTAIATGARLKSTGIVFPLTMPASISGTVTAEEGEPVRGAQVWIFRRGVAQGRFQTRQEGVQRSDASGHFQFDRLKPGVYIVAAQAQPWYAQNALDQSQQPVNPELDIAYPTTYYGGTSDSNSAYAITLGEGEALSIEINLRAERAIHVRVNGPSLADHQPPLLFALGPDGQLLPSNGSFVSNETRQEVTGITAGRYVVALPSKRDASGIGARKTVDLAADSTLDVSDLQDVPPMPTVAQDAQEPVKGGSKIEGVAMKDGQPFAGAMVLLVPKDASRSSLLRRDQSDSDGTFSLTDIAPGQYTLIAIDDGRDLAYAENGALDVYQKSGRSLEIPPAGNAKFQVEVVSRRR